MSKKTTIFLISFVLLIGLLSPLVFILGDDHEYDPRNWTPFITIYRAPNCVEPNNTDFRVCSLIGHRSPIADVSLFQIIEGFDFQLKNKNNNDTTKMSLESLDCRDSVSKNKVDLQLIAKKGTSFECWFKTPLDADIEIVRSSP